MAGKDLDDAFADFLGNNAPKAADTRPDGRLLKIPLQRLAPNRVNPRTDFGNSAELLDLGKSLARHQNQPCPVVSRRAYLKLWPDHADLVADVDYVLVSGERRFRAATEVGMASLQCVVNDDVAADRKTFMEAVVSENIDRRNFDAIEEANAVAAMALEFGSNRAVAQHFERADAWVTQRIDLTHLSSGLQNLVRAKDIPLEDARILGRLVKNKEMAPEYEAQLAWWEGRKAEKAAKAAAKAAARQAERAAKKVASPADVGFTAVKPPASAPSSPAGPADSAAGPTAPAGPSASPAPGQPSAGAAAPAEPEQPLPEIETPLDAPDSAEAADAVPGPRATREAPADGGTDPADRDESASPARHEQTEKLEFLARPKMPWHDGEKVADLVTAKMPIEQQRVLFQRLQSLLMETAGQ
ncbi:ParB/RepB/Spo0J family partition protein [Streptomyces hydrogenans]|uniref:ParB/RepB/Spo0J family partition protein n=1 Tax=Streptomyces hydrogenans TaxID=1873719 RepID=UPI0036E79F1C